MLFNSLIFLYAFLPITYLVFWRLRTQRARYVWLTITGYVFYSFWNYKFCALLGFSTIVSYLAGLGLAGTTDRGRRRFFLIGSIVSDLAVLAFFKYADFGLSSFAAIGRWLGFDLHVSPLNIVLLLDLSGSTEKKMKIMKRAAKSFVDSLNPTDRIAIAGGSAWMQLPRNVRYRSRESSPIESGRVASAAPSARSSTSPAIRPIVSGSASSGSSPTFR